MNNCSDSNTNNYLITLLNLRDIPIQNMKLYELCTNLNQFSEHYRCRKLNILF